MWRDSLINRSSRQFLDIKLDNTKATILLWQLQSLGVVKFDVKKLSAQKIDLMWRDSLDQPLEQTVSWHQTWQHQGNDTAITAEPWTELSGTTPEMLLSRSSPWPFSSPYLCPALQWPLLLQYAFSITNYWVLSRFSHTVLYLSPANLLQKLGSPNCMAGSSASGDLQTST